MGIPLGIGMSIPGMGGIGAGCVGGADEGGLEGAAGGAWGG
jgi:hypothetical protein